ncbi:MAG: ATP-binding protein [Actinomycetales bacterium]
MPVDEVERQRVLAEYDLPHTADSWPDGGPAQGPAGGPAEPGPAAGATGTTPPAGRQPAHGLPDREAPDHAAPDPAAHLRNLLELARTLTGQPFAVINIITADRQHQIAALGIDPRVCRREDAMCSIGFLNGTTTVVDDASVDPRYRSNPYVDGSRGSIRFYVSVPLTAPGGAVLGTFCVGSRESGRLSAAQQVGLETLAAQVVDILELRRTSRLLATALAEAHRSNALLADFAGRISHDLRNPLASILGFVELSAMVPDATPDSSEAKYLQFIGATGRRMLTTVEELLTFATVGGTLKPSRLSLAEVVREVVADLDLTLSEHGAQVEVDDVDFTADPGQARILLQNLIHNACVYARPGVPARIRVSGTCGAEGTELRITDNGKGIAPPDRERVLEPLVRLHRSGDPGGSGLGLATCARIAAAHGGTLELDDAPGGGTVVTVRLAPRTQLSRS